MSKLQYMTLTRFGQIYSDVQDLDDEQQGQVMVLKDLANAYMSTKDLNFRDAVNLAHSKLPEDSVVNSELGFQIEMAKRYSMDPVAIIEAVEDHVGQ